MPRRTSPPFRRRRLARQLREMREDACLTLEEAAPLLELTAIIDEAALAREVGGRAVMREQLHHLLAVGQLGNVTIQVMPFSSGAHDAMSGPFIVLQFPEIDEPDLLYVAHPTGAHHIEKAEQVREARLVFDRLRSQAMSPPDSAVLIERLIADRRAPSSPSRPRPGPASSPPPRNPPHLPSSAIVGM